MLPATKVEDLRSAVLKRFEVMVDRDVRRSPEGGEHEEAAEQEKEGKCERQSKGTVLK